MLEGDPGTLEPREEQTLPGEVSGCWKEKGRFWQTLAWLAWEGAQGHGQDPSAWLGDLGTPLCPMDLSVPRWNTLGDGGISGWVLGSPLLQRRGSGQGTRGR